MPDLKRALASLLALPLLVLAGCPTNDALWHANADTDVDQGDNTLYFRKEVTSGDWRRLGIVADPAGRYGKVYRAYLTAADIDNGDDRAEFSQALLRDGSTKLKLGVPGTTNIWFGWRSRFGGSVVINGGNDGNWMQLKGDSSCGGPTLGMTIVDQHLTLRSERYLSATDGIAWDGPTMTSLLDGKWHTFLLHVAFAKNNTGYLEVVLDGKPQRMVNGKGRINFPTMCPNDTYVYPKLGVYSMADGAPTHWIESPRIGLTQGSAVPR